MQTQVEIRKFHAESRIHAARGIWEHLAYSFALRFVSIYHRLLFALFHYRDAFVNLIELYIVICEWYSVYLQPVQTEVQIIFVSLNFLQIARGSKEAGKIGPKKSIMKGRKILAFCQMKKS